MVQQAEHKGLFQTPSGTYFDNLFRHLAKPYGWGLQLTVDMT